MKRILTCLLFLNWAIANCQEMPSMVPPSPKTQEFNKYLNYSVSMYNGLPQISIPLYEIKVGGLIIPINLTYHASGIKMRQDNGDVGVGWTLNPGYRVSRTVNGFADEYQFMPTSYDSVSYYSFDPTKRDRYLARFMDNQFDRPYTSGSDKLDGEYDMFNFNLASESGSFIITNRTTRTVATIDSSNVKIDYSTAAATVPGISGITGVKITDGSGIVHYAGEYLSGVNNWVYESNSQYGGYLGTSWAVTDIVTPMGEQVHFKYSPGSSGGWMPNQKSFTFSERVPIDNVNDIASNAGEVSNGQDNSYTTFLMGEITSPNEKITFNRNNVNRVTSILITTAANEPLKKIQFYYSENQLHSFLDSLKVQDAANNTAQTYRFDYYDKNVNPLDMVHDQWGYYKLHLGNSPYAHLFHQEFFDDQFLVDHNFYTQPISLLFDEPAPRSQVTEAPVYFSLRKITYPTGGSTEYEYESNRSADIYYNIVDGGGLRIRKIKHFVENGNLSSTRMYVYGQNENGYGISPVMISHNLFVNETLRLRTVPNVNDRWPQRIVTYSTNIQGDLDPQGYASSYVIYPEVTEYHGVDNLSNPLLNGGKVVYRYDIGYQYLAGQLSSSGSNVIPHSQYRSYSPFYVHSYRTWDKPLLREKITYRLNSTMTGFQRVQREAFSYGQKAFRAFTGLKVRPFATADDYIPSATDFYNYIPSFFDYGEYVVNCNRTYLSEKRDVSYSGNDSSAVVANYNYNSLNLPIREGYTGSMGELHEKIFAYPKEMVDSNRDPNGVYLAMVNRNIITPQIEERQLVSSVQHTLSRNNYINPHPGVYVPGEVVTQGLATNPEETRIQYYGYDNKGNVLSVSKFHGPKTNYIWSYNGKYPVAKIENADYTTIVGVLGGQTAIDDFATSSPTDTQINDLIAQLRSHTLLRDAQITSYTYKPMVGMASQTDAKGMTIFYGYDEFNRLETVKDHNGQIIKKYDFHHKP